MKRRWTLWAALSFAIVAATLIQYAIADQSRAQNNRAPEMQAQLDQLAEDFNMMYKTRTPIRILLNGSRVKQRQTFLGVYQKTGEGDYLQKNICDTLNETTFAPFGAAEGEQRLTIEDGRIIVRVTYQYKGGGPRPCPPAAVDRLGNGIIFHEIDGNGGGWHSNEFYFARDGRHESIRRFDGQPAADGDVFAEVEHDKE